MNASKCSVRNCTNTRLEAILHKFPNPEKDLNRFNRWINVIGGNTLVIDPASVFKNGRICHSHFETKYYTVSKRLSNIAVPTLYLSGNCLVKSHLQNVTNLKSEANYLGQQSKSIMQSVPLSPNQQTSSKVEQPAPSKSKGNCLVSSHLQNVTNLKREANYLGQRPESIMQRAPLSPNQPTSSKVEQPASSASKGKQDGMDFLLNSEVVMLKYKLKKLKEQKDAAMKRLKKALKLSENATFLKALKKFSPAANIFMHLQFREAGKHKLGCRFTKDEKIMSLALYKQGPRAYRWLRKMFVLPSPLTLSRMISRPSASKNN